MALKFRIFIVAWLMAFGFFSIFHFLLIYFHREECAPWHIRFQNFSSLSFSLGFRFFANFRTEHHHHCADVQHNLACAKHHEWEDNPHSHLARPRLMCVCVCLCSALLCSLSLFFCVHKSLSGISCWLSNRLLGFEWLTGYFLWRNGTYFHQKNDSSK